MLLRTYKLFISHAWHRDQEYRRVVRLLNEQAYFRWEDLSVPQDRPIAIYSEHALPYELRNRIRDCEAFIACAGMWVHYSDWIKFEIAFARRIGKPIIGVPPWGQIVLPAVIAQNAVARASQSSTLVAAIRAHAKRDGL